MKTIALVSGSILLLSACAADPPAGPPPHPTGQTVALGAQAIFTVNPEDHSVVSVPTTGGEPTRHGVGGRPTRALATAERLYLTLRSERAVAVFVHSQQGRVLEPVARVEVGHEPFGLALSPDGSRLYVAASLSEQVVVVDTAHLEVVERIAVAGQPRWLALHPSGRTLFVGTLMAGLQRVDTTRGEVTPIDLHERENHVVRVVGDPAVAPDGASLLVPVLDIDVGLQFAASTEYYASQAVVPFLSEYELEPADGALINGPRVIGVETAVGPSIASVSFTPGSELVVVASEGGGQAAMLPSITTRRAAGAQWDVFARAQEALTGVSGVVFDAQGRGYAQRFLERGLAQVDIDVADPLDHHAALSDGDALSVEILARWPTGLSDQAEHGRRLFHDAANRGMTTGAAVCATCHPDGRSDNVTWRLGDGLRQTRTLAERVSGHTPLGWAADRDSVADGAMQTVVRMGGAGIQMRDAQAIQAYVDGLDLPDIPGRGAVTAEIERGQALFAELGCASCHAGEAYTDRTKHALTGRAEMATPSLRGVAITGPYLHDGAAPTLEAVLAMAPSLGKGATDRLTVEERAALLAFLRSL